jgi:hypothetical protein
MVLAGRIMHPQPANFFFFYIFLFLALGGGSTTSITSKGQEATPDRRSEAIWGGFVFKLCWSATTWGDQPPQKKITN